MAILYKKLEFDQERELLQTEEVRMINRCAAINKWKNNVNGTCRIISITSKDHCVELWCEVGSGGVSTW